MRSELRTSQTDAANSNLPFLTRGRAMRFAGFVIACLLQAAYALALPRAARAQEARGTVRDSASQQPIPGAVISLLDASGATLGRNITNDQGRYDVVLPGSATQLRFVRIGFRPSTVAIRRSGATIDTIDVVMHRLPTMLEPVQITANGCPNRSDAGSAAGLLQQARASLLNSIVARSANPALLTLLRFQRSMDGTSDRIRDQTVRIDSTARSKLTFGAVRSAAEFIQSGFVADDASGLTYFGPDADALLDDAFVAAYCFRLVGAGRDRPGEVGLGFAAPKRQKNRIDIDGVLWVDTTNRRLRQLEFRYVGLDRSLDPARPGGILSFRDAANGVVFIDRWSLRLPIVREESTFVSAKGEYAKWSTVEAQEAGGEVARAEWPGQPVWNASLGTLRLSARAHAGKPATGVRIRLDDTDYRGRSDANGEITIRNLLPGPYTLVVLDSALETIGLTLTTPVKFIAARDSVHHVSLDVPTADDLVYERCRADRAWKNPIRSAPGIVWVFGRAVDASGKPVEGIRVGMSHKTGADTTRGNLQMEATSTPTGTNGLFELCPTVFHVGEDAQVRVFTHRRRIRSLCARSAIRSW